MAIKKSSVKSTVDSIVSSIRLDGWSNVLTGLGLTATDKIQSHVPTAVSRLADRTLENLYHGDAIPARIVEKIVEDALRQGVEIEAPAEVEHDQVEAVEAAWKKLNVTATIKAARIWGRLYGSGAVLLGVDDGQTVDQPLALERIRSIRFLRVLDGTEYSTSSWYSDPLSGNFGEPETYMINSFGSRSLGAIIHESRMIVFGGASTSRRLRKEMGDRDFSVLQRPMDAIRRFDSDWRSTSAMMVDGSQGVLKIKDFADVLAGGSETKELFETRMQIVNLGRSVSRIMPIDADSEDFQYVERGWAGVADLLDKTTLYLSASTGIPITVLFGRSPSGMDATGEGDRNQWYDSVQSEREDVLLPRAERLLEIVLQSCGIDPTGWEISFPSLIQESSTDLALRKKTVAETDAIYISNDVVSPEEIAVARFGSGSWSDESPAVDVEARQKIIDMDLIEAPKEEVAEEEIPDKKQEIMEVAEKIEAPIIPDAVPPSSALNGAQVTALLDIINRVALDMLPRQSAIELIISAFPVDEAQADRILGEVGKGFKPAVPDATKQ